MDGKAAVSKFWHSSCKNNCYMDIGLPTILLGGLAYQGGTGIAPSKQGETKSDPVSADDNSADNSSQASPTDNNLSDTQNMPINRQVQKFSQAYCEGIKAVAGQSASQNTEPEEPSVIKKEMVLEPKDGCEFAQIFAEFNALKLPSSTECALSPAENQTTTGCVQTSGLVQTIDSNDQNAGETVQPLVLAMPVIANSAVEEGINCDESPISGKTVVSEKYLANQVIAKKAATEILTDGIETAADDEMSTMADKPIVFNGQKTPVDTSLLASIDRSATLVEKTTDNKADTGQQAVLSSPELSESLLDKDKDRVDNNVLNDSLLKKLNFEQIISINKAKDNDNSSTTNSNLHDNSPKTFKQIFSVSGAQYSVTEHSSAAASASKMANTALPSDVSTSVGKQIQESIHSSLKQGEQQITIHLDPPELGKVSIKLQEQNGQIVGLLEVSKAQTRTEIQQALPQIIQNLAESGVQVKRLEVLLTNQQEQQGFKDPSLATGADGWSGSPRFAGEAGQGQAGANYDSQSLRDAWVGANGWLTNNQQLPGFIEPGVQITDDSINILV